MTMNKYLVIVDSYICAQFPTMVEARRWAFRAGYNDFMIAKILEWNRREPPHGFG